MHLRPQHRTDSSYTRLLSAHSDVIRISRVLCIVMMTYVHVHLFHNTIFLNTPYFLISHNLFANLLGRSSVPLLSAISGFLMVSYFLKRGIGASLKMRFLTLIVPMVFWNTLGMTADFCAGNKVTFTSINNILSLSGHGYYIHLTFLRDIFVISLFFPLLDLLIKKYRELFLLGIILITAFIDLSPVILRDQILIYFLFGIYIAHFDTDFLFYAKQVQRITLTLFALLLLVTACQPFFPAYFFWIDNQSLDILVRRPLCALSFWYFSLILAQTTVFKQLVTTYLEPAVFTLFLCHLFVAQVIGSLYAQYEPWHTAFGYYCVWLGIPCVAMLVSILIKKGLTPMPPFLSVLVSGKMPRKASGPKQSMPAQTEAAPSQQ